MSAFSMKAPTSNQGNSGGKSVSPEEWEAWNNYIAETVGPVKSRLGVIAAIIDLGYHPATKMYDWEDSELQQKVLQNNETARVEEVGGKQKLIFEKGTVQKLALMVDFPQVKVDYGKHPYSEQESDVRPWRALVGGEFQGDVSIPFTYDDYQCTNPKASLHKIAAVAGVAEELEKTKDVGVLLGKPVMYEAGIRDNGKYKNEVCKSLHTINEYVPVADILKDYPLEPFGVGFDMDNSEEHLKQLRWSVRSTMSRAVNFKDSKIESQLEEIFGKMETQDNSKPSSESGAQADEPAGAPPELDDFDDDLDF